MPHQPMSAPPHAPLDNRRRAHPALGVVPAALWLPTLASAHGGHGPSGAHWHPTDAWGLLMLAAVFGASVWWARRK